MFCYQCEQAALGSGCSTKGVCGKDSTTADLQDLLVEVAKKTAEYAHSLRELNICDIEADRFVIDALFTTVTNVNFDYKSIREWILKGEKINLVLVDKLNKFTEKKYKYQQYIKENDSYDYIVNKSKNYSILNYKNELGDSVAGVIEMIISGLKGAAAYAHHARVLGKEDKELYAKFHKALSFTASKNRDLNTLLDWSLKTGEINLQAMEILDKANTEAYGHPEPTEVLVTPKEGKAILVSGHDLKDLYDLLVATEGKGINIYTHGEMLPCHAYPKLKKFKHLVGNYGGAWQVQQKEFAEFPGAILMTTNCIQSPKEIYANNIFTTGLVEYPGIKHVKNADFGEVIKAALASTGFTNVNLDEKKILVGFGHNAVMNVAGQVVDAVKQGKIRHFFLVGGCDGAKAGRNYYTEFAEKAPKDTVLLTLACGKFRFNKLEFGDINGIPRLLDIGQCNDAYSAIKIASALAEAFNCGVNDLPLSLILSWYEQKAVAILLSLLYLGIKNIRLGPTLPAFLTPEVLNVLVEKFAIKAITTAEEDLKTILAA